MQYNFISVLNMKKLKITSIVLIVFFIATISCWKSSSVKENDSSLMLENMEALAQGEEGFNYICYGTGSIDCPIGYAKVEGYYMYNSLD